MPRALSWGQKSFDITVSDVHTCAATCQCLGCTVKPFIHNQVLFQGEDLQHKHSNVSQNTWLFSHTHVFTISGFGYALEDYTGDMVGLIGL